MPHTRDDVVDLRSDTVTRPTAGMRTAIANAVVGDDVLGDDPTVHELEARVAALLGKQAALFMPSGIMANQAALIVLAPRGTEVICEATCHLIDWEIAGASANAGVQLRGIATTAGILDPDAIERAIRPRAARVQLQTSLIALENTHNAAGGRIMPIGTMRAIRDVAQRHALPVYLDGARLWHAATASGVDEAEYAACADLLMVTLSKGLGCPVGSMLAGSSELIDRARIVRRRLGGAMRQAGVLAAAGLYALEHHRARLREDHARARTLADSTKSLNGIRVVEPESNIVMFDLLDGRTAGEVLDELKQRGVLMTEFTSSRIRAVTHLDVNDAGIERAVNALETVFR